MVWRREKVGSVIPQIVHQTWKTRPIPAEYQALQQSWLDLHPGWAYRFWTDDECRALVADEYRWFLPTYDGYDEAIKRADAFRYFVLHRHGGVYADLDCEAVRPFGDLLAGREVVLGYEPISHAEHAGVRSRKIDNIICNALMASVPGHPFWDHAFRILEAAREQPNVLDATGPLILTHMHRTYPEPERVTVVQPEAFYPYDRWEVRDGAVTVEQLRARVPASAYAIHYWHGTWRYQQIFSQIRKRMTERRRVHPGADG